MMLDPAATLSPCSCLFSMSLFLVLDLGAPQDKILTNSTEVLHFLMIMGRRRVWTMTIYLQYLLCLLLAANSAKLFVSPVIDPQTATIVMRMMRMMKMMESFGSILPSHPPKKVSQFFLAIVVELINWWHFFPTITHRQTNLMNKVSDPPSLTIRR